MKKSRDVHSQYLRKKNYFLSKFSNIKAWAIWISIKRLGALQEILDYISETLDLSDEDDNLTELVYKDHVNFLLGKLTPIPRELKESMILSDKPHLSYSKRQKGLSHDVQWLRFCWGS
jgi:hypothetical protein